MFVNKRLLIHKEGTFRTNQQPFCFANGCEIPN